MHQNKAGPAGNAEQNEFGQIACEMGVTSAELGVIEKRFKVSRNEFFITVAALAVSLFAGKRLDTYVKSMKKVKETRKP